MLLYYKILVYIIHLLRKANNRCCISHTTSTCIERFVVFELLKWASNPASLQVLGLYISLHNMLPQIFSYFLKIVYLQMSYFGFNLLKISHGALSTAFIPLRLTTLSFCHNFKRSMNLAISLLRGIIIVTIVLLQRSHSS